MKSAIKKGFAALSLVAIISFGTYAFATRAADTSSGGTNQTPNMGTTNPNAGTTNPSMGTTNPNTGTTNPNANRGTTTQPGSQTNVYVPQSGYGYAGYMAAPYYGGETLGDLIVLNGLFGSGANTVTQTTTTDDDCHSCDDKTTVTTTGVSGLNGNADLAGLIAVNNLLSPYGGGIGYGAGYGGYVASPAYGYSGGYGAGETLGGLIVLNGLFGNNGVTAVTTTTDDDPTTVVTSDGNALNRLSPDARGLAGLIAVNNLTSPVGYGVGAGYGGYVASPAYGYSGGYGVGDTLGGLIVLNGLFGNNGVTAVTTTTDDDPTTVVTSDGSLVNGLGNGLMSSSAKDLAGLIAVNNTTSPMGGIGF